MPPHGLMFHHFHDKYAVAGQGSIVADTLDRIIDHYAEHHRLLDAVDYLNKAVSGTLDEDDVCLTFDDSLLCQYQIALPVLQRRGITAFWFVYSGVITGGIEVLEVYRRFRTEYFADVDAFYLAFFAALEHSAYAAEAERALSGFDVRAYLADYPFYSDNDRKFRFLRDKVLCDGAYDELMQSLIRDAGSSLEQLAEDLWMQRAHLQALHADGHIIGLHSHSHPTSLGGLSKRDQQQEYRHNLDVLSDITGERPRTMSHPCNSYTGETLQILDALGIVLGFRSNMVKAGSSRFEHPREDHANIVKRLGL